MIFILSPLVATSPGSVLSAGEIMWEGPQCPERLRLISGERRLPACLCQSSSDFWQLARNIPKSSPASSRLLQAGSQRSPEETLRSDDSAGRLAKLNKRLLTPPLPFARGEDTR